MRIVGLTGQTGAGKSTVGRLFTERGVPSVDCDLVSREVVEPGTECLSALAATFGKGILRADGSLDRHALGRVVFSDKNELERLNQLMFPAIRKRLKQKLDVLNAQGIQCVLLDAPTLFESGVDALCHQIISVTAGEELRLERICERDGLSADEARNRMESQHTEEWFRAHSDIVLENNGDLEELTAQVEAALSRLCMETTG